MTEARLRELGVFVKPGFFDRTACAIVRAAMDRGRAEPAEIYAGDYLVDERVRRTSDVAVDSQTVRLVEDAFAHVREEVSRFFDVALSAAEGPGFLRYLPGDFYRAHQDRIDGPGQMPGQAPGQAPGETPRETLSRTVSLVLFLADADRGAGDACCAGGSLRLYGVIDSVDDRAPLDIPPAAGTLVAFRSHVLHEVLPVTGGVRDAIVDWFY